MPRSIPKTNRNWLREIERAFEKAALKVERKVRPADEIYKFAPQLAGSRRGIHSDDIARATKKIDKSIQAQRAIENPGEYIFEFYSAYLEAHVLFGFLDEMEVDPIMTYLVHNV